MIGYAEDQKCPLPPGHLRSCVSGISLPPVIHHPVYVHIVIYLVISEAYNFWHSVFCTQREHSQKSQIGNMSNTPFWWILPPDSRVDISLQSNNSNSNCVQQKSFVFSFLNQYDKWCETQANCSVQSRTTFSQNKSVYI